MAGLATASGVRIAKLSRVKVSERTLVLIAFLAILLPLVVTVPIWIYAIYYPVLAVVAGLLGARLVVEAFHEMVSQRRPNANVPTGLRHANEVGSMAEPPPGSDLSVLAEMVGKHRERAAAVLEAEAAELREAAQRAHEEIMEWQRIAVFGADLESRLRAILSLQVAFDRSVRQALEAMSRAAAIGTRARRPGATARPL